MHPKCPLFENDKVVCRVKPESKHRWLGTERAWYIRNYCEEDYYVDCEDFEAYLEQQAINKGKILIVDDETSLLEALGGFFSSRGYQVMTATSAEAALMMMSQEKPALTLIDIKLPGMDGIDLLKQIKKEYPLTKTFVITAYDEENKKTVEEIGVDGFFAKPIGLDELKREVVRVLANVKKPVTISQADKERNGKISAKLLFISEVLPNEKDRLTPYLRSCFTDPEQCGGRYQVEFAYSISDSAEKLISFNPDIVLINFDSLYEIQCGQLASRIAESPYRPKEILVYGLNLQASDKEVIKGLGIQYVDQRRSFAKLVTAVKQIATSVHD